jgi:hypothetical protein
MDTSTHRNLGKRSSRQGSQKSSQTTPGNQSRTPVHHTNIDTTPESDAEDLDQEMDKSRVGIHLAVGGERENHIQIHPGPYPQDPTLASRLEEVAERTAHPNADGEDWVKRFPMEKESPGVRGSRMCLW